MLHFAFCLSPVAVGIVTSRTVHVCAYTYWLCGPCHKNVSCYAGQHPPSFSTNRTDTKQIRNWSQNELKSPKVFTSYRAVHHYLLYFLHLALFCPPTAPKKSEFLVLPFADGRHRRHVHSPARRDGSSLSGEFSFLFFCFQFDLIVML